MLKIARYSFVVLTTVFCLNGIALADNSPGIDQVYQAAREGRMDEAQKMMNVVLRNHPNSAKAHYVEAEILSRQGMMQQAANELNIARRLKPDLSFANVQAVRELENRVNAAPVGTATVADNAQGSGTRFPWTMVVLALGVIAIIVFVLRAMGSRNPATSQSNFQPGWSNGSMSPLPYGGGIAPTGSPGIGSGIMGGLATGAAVGVGMVAGEALAHHFLDGNSTIAAANAAPVADNWGSSTDMGGSDFGLTDNSSWNDSSDFADTGSDAGSGDWS
jgi:uncharacterized protein